MKKNCLVAVFTLYKPMQALYSRISRLFRKHQCKSHPAVHTFCQSEEGAFAIIFACTFPVMLGLIAWAIEGPRYIYQKARLSDALEQSALALTVADHSQNKGNNLKNQELVSNYIKAYMPDDIIDSKKDIKSINIKRILAGNDMTVTWRPDATTRHTPWFPLSTYVPGFPSEVRVGENAGARIKQAVPQQPEEMAVVFVIDFSTSMGEPFRKVAPGLHRAYQTKNWELKRIIRKLTGKVYSNRYSEVGFVPFAVGVTEQAADGSRRCAIPWYSDLPVTDLAAIKDKFVPPLTTADYRDREDHDKLYNLIRRYVNIDETLNRIMEPVVADRTVSIPIKQVGYYFCDYHEWPDGVVSPLPPSAQLSVIPLTTNSAALDKIDRMKPLGGTFTTSGILAGVKLLHESQAKNKRLIIISDGQESVYLDITKALISRGMCEKIKQHGIVMEFIGIEYSSPETMKTLDGDQWIDWQGTCVGASHFYTPDTMSTLEDALSQAVLSKVQEEVGRNVRK